MVLRNGNTPPPGYECHNLEDHIMNLHGMETSNRKYFIFCRSYAFGTAPVSLDLLASLTLNTNGKIKWRVQHEPRGPEETKEIFW
jgi:hypothetical protein